MKLKIRWNRVFLAALACYLLAGSCWLAVESHFIDPEVNKCHVEFEIVSRGFCEQYVARMHENQK